MNSGYTYRLRKLRVENQDDTHMQAMQLYTTSCDIITIVCFEIMCLSATA